MREVLIIDDNRSSSYIGGFPNGLEAIAVIIVETVDEGLERMNASESLRVVLLNVELSADRGLVCVREN